MSARGMVGQAPLYLLGACALAAVLLFYTFSRSFRQYSVSVSDIVPAAGSAAPQANFGVWA
jgi:hypothetical protein